MYLPAGVGELFKAIETVQHENPERTEVAEMVAELEEGFVYFWVSRCEILRINPVECFCFCVACQAQKNVLGYNCTTNFLTEKRNVYERS